MKYIYSICLIALLQQCTIEPKEDCEDCSSSVQAYEFTVEMRNFLYNISTGDYVVSTQNMIGGTELVIKPGDLVAIYVNIKKRDDWFALPQNLYPVNYSPTNPQNEFSFVMKEDYNNVQYKGIEFYIKPENKKIFGNSTRPYSNSTEFIYRVVVSSTNNQIKNTFSGYDEENFIKI